MVVLAYFIIDVGLVTEFVSTCLVDPVPVNDCVYSVQAVKPDTSPNGIFTGNVNIAWVPKLSGKEFVIHMVLSLPHTGAMCLADCHVGV